MEMKEKSALTGGREKRDEKEREIASAVGDWNDFSLSLETPPETKGLCQ
jgi:hypothetical protein